MIQEASRSVLRMSLIWPAALLGMLVGGNRWLMAEDVQLLTIGSMAPPLDIVHWISDGQGKFEPVNEFQPGKIYVIEFWATWCGPCIQSMPHLARLQEKYSDEIQIISISDEEPERVRRFMEREYQPNAEEESSITYGILTSVYCVAADPDRSCFKDYMESSVRDTIPTTFIVGRDGRIEFIGHPTFIDRPLAKVVEGTWDREAFAEKFTPKQKMELVMKDLRESVSSNPQEAIDKIDLLMPEIKLESEKRELDWLKMEALANCDRYTEATQMAQMLAQLAPNDSMKRDLSWHRVIYLIMGGELSHLADAVSEYLAFDQKDRGMHFNEHILLADAVGKAFETGRQIDESVIDILIDDLQTLITPQEYGDSLAMAMDALARYQWSQGKKAQALESLRIAQKEARYKPLVKRISEFISRLGD